MPEQLLESRPLAEASAVVGATGKLSVQLITPGWGSSGYYAPKVLEAAAGAKVFPAGTHMYLDHPSASENYERPERSVRDLAAVLTSDATWDGQALVAEAQTFGPYREALIEMRDVIGVSIRAAAEVEMGEAEGRRGRIVTELVEGTSVDFVTHAGRGGRVLAVLESARPSRVVERVVARGVAEASARDMREQLSTLLTDAYGGEKTWTWVRDFDPDAHLVWYELETPDSSGVFQHDYTAANDGALSLSGTPIEVRVQTSYVPVDATASTTAEALAQVQAQLELMQEDLADAEFDRDSARESAAALARLLTIVPVTPAGQSTSPTESQEDTMPQIEEARLRQLEADAGRVQTLESERDAATTRADTAERQLAEATARTAALPIVAAVLAESQTLPAATQNRVTAQVVAAAPLTESGTLDETALRTAAETARTAAETEIASVLEAHGVGKPRNLGASALGDEGDGISEAEFNATLGLTTTTGA